MEVEEMIRRVRDEQGRPFDVRQLTTSCVANVIMNMLFGFPTAHFRHALGNLQFFIRSSDISCAAFSSILCKTYC